MFAVIVVRDSKDQPKFTKKKKKIFQSFRSCGNLAVVRNVDTVSTALTGEERVTFNPRNYAWRITVKCRTQVIQDKNKSDQTNKCFQETFPNSRSYQEPQALFSSLMALK